MESSTIDGCLTDEQYNKFKQSLLPSPSGDNVIYMDIKPTWIQPGGKIETAYICKIMAGSWCVTAQAKTSKDACEKAVLTWNKQNGYSDSTLYGVYYNSPVTGLRDLLGVFNNFYKADDFAKKCATRSVETIGKINEVN